MPTPAAQGTGIPPLGRLYVGLLLAAGLVLTALELGHLGTPEALPLALALCVAALAPMRRVDGPSDRSTYDVSLVAIGFALLTLGPAAAVLVILASCLASGLWHRSAWYVVAANAAALTAALSAADSVAKQAARIPAGPGGEALALVGGTVVFVVVNHVLVGLFIKLVRREGFHDSGALSRRTFIIDATLLIMGTIGGLVWRTDPYAVALVLLPVYVVSAAMRLPRLEREALTDSKTGLFNARYFTVTLEKELERADRFDRPLSVVMADLDLLRNVNNAHGHLAGDAVLAGVARILEASVRDYDTVARLGGEEFAICMPDTDLMDAVPRVQAIRAAIESAEFLSPITGTVIKATMSFGVADRHLFGMTAAELLHQADQGVYQAKLNGRNRVCLPPGGRAGFQGTGPRSGVAATSSPDPGISRPPAAPQTTTAGGPVPGPPRQEEAGGVTRHRVTALIALLSLAALAGAAAGLPGAPPVEGAGLLAAVILGLLAEFLGVDIRNGGVRLSGSVAPLLAGTLLFGPVGALAMAVTLACAALLRDHSSLQRWALDASTHFLAALACLAAAESFGPGREQGGLAVRVLPVLLAAGAHLVVSGGVGAAVVYLETGRAGTELVRRRLAAPAPYQLALGMIAYSLIAAYQHQGALGMVALALPLLLLRWSQQRSTLEERSGARQTRLANAELSHRAITLADLNEDLLGVISNLVDLRESDLLGHSQDVARSATLIAEELRLPAEQVQLVRWAGLLHDIGKFTVPEALLSKPARLSSGEYETVKQHAVLGASLIASSPSLRRLAPLVRHHHERFDGAGYPDRLAGQEIPLESRILAVADAAESMAAARAYRRPRTCAQVLSEIERHAGAQFDPEVVAAFRRVTEGRGAWPLERTGSPLSLRAVAEPELVAHL